MVTVAGHDEGWTGTFPANLLTTNFTPLFGTMQQYRYDASCFHLLLGIAMTKLEFRLPRITEGFERYSGLMLLCIVEVGKCEEDEISRLKSDSNELDTWFEDVAALWENLGRPRSEQFRLRIVREKPSSSRSDIWSFPREEHYLVLGLHD